MRTLIVYILLITVSGFALNAQSFTSFDTTKIAYTDEGSGEPIILIHGFINDGSSWRGSALYEALLTQGYRVIIPDLRGNGDSGKPKKEEAYADNAEIKDLQALLDHLQIKVIIAIGYSRGAIVVSKWITQDSRIKKGVIGGMGLDFSDPLWDRRIIFEEAFLGTTPLTEDTRGAVNYARSKNADLKALGWSQRHQPVTSKQELAQITIPILVIAGDQDQDNGNPQDLADSLPNAQLKIIHGDHSTTYRKRSFSQEILQYLSK